MSPRSHPASASRRLRKWSPACPARPRSIETGDDGAEPIEDVRGAVTKRIGKHQQEFLAPVTAEPVEVADVGEHGDGEGPEHFIAGGVAVGVVDALEPVEIDQRDRKGGLAAMGPANLVIQLPNEKAAIDE